MAYITDSNAFTEDTTLMADWRSDDLTGKQVDLNYWVSTTGGDCAVILNSYSPELEGQTIKVSYLFKVGGITDNPIALIKTNLSKKFVTASNVTFGTPPVSFECWIDGYSKKTLKGDASNVRITYTLSK